MRIIDADALMTEFMDSDLDHLQRDDWKEVIQIVADAPTVNPEPHWIPVTERLPEKTGRYLAWAVVSFIPDHVDELNTIKQIAIASYSTRTWFGDNVEDVIAWMPLPEPYKGVTT